VVEGLLEVTQRLHSTVPFILTAFKNEAQRVELFVDQPDEVGSVAIERP
jgi:hypothetical protein